MATSTVGPKWSQTARMRANVAVSGSIWYVMHVFLSYARDDIGIIQPLSLVLRAVGVHPWLDTTNVPPGSAQWDQMIRHALRDARAVLAFCSDKSRDSEYVAIELEIAKGYQQQIFPIWVAGRNWSQSAPVSLILSQYVDLRELRREGVTELVPSLKRHLASLSSPGEEPGDKWPFVRIDWKDAHFYLNPFAYNNWGELLSAVYLSLLKDDFAPFSYGETWALEISGRAGLYPGSKRGNELWWPL